MTCVEGPWEKRKETHVHGAKPGRVARGVTRGAFTVRRVCYGPTPVPSPGSYVKVFDLKIACNVTPFGNKSFWLC